MAKKSVTQKISRANEIDARRTIIEEMFNDMYRIRRNIYWMNFTRGIFFGVGSVLGGALIIAISITVLSPFVDWFPVLGGFINKVLEAMGQN